MLDEDESWWSDIQYIESAAPPGLLGDLLEVTGARDASREMIAIFVQSLEDRELQGLAHVESEVADIFTVHHTYVGAVVPNLWP